MNSRKSIYLFATFAVAILLIELSILILRSSERMRWKDVPTLVLDDSFDSADVRDAGLKRLSFMENPEGLKGSVEQLSFTKGLCGIFIDPENASRHSKAVELFYFEYEAGNPRFLHDIFGHSPEVCMKATGATLRKIHPSRTVEVEGEKLTVKVFEFGEPVTGRILWVFKLTWLPENDLVKTTDGGSVLRREKLQMGFMVNPRPPARVVLVGTRNFSTQEEAWNAFDQLVLKRLKFDTTRNVL